VPAASRAWDRRRAVGAAPALVGAAVAAAYLLAPPMGADLAAQLTFADMAREQWPVLLDRRWYGGINPLGYSVLSPPVMVLLGVRVATALGYLAGVVLLAALLRHTGVPRPVLGGVAGALCLTGNLASSRTTFTLGLAVGLGSLLAVARRRPWLSDGLAVVAALTSPVAGLFLGLCGLALALSGRTRDGLRVSAAALAPTVAVGVLLGNGGRMPFAGDDAAKAALVSLLVAAVCWRSPVLRLGALGSASLVGAAFVLPTPVGSNAARLSEMLGPPALVACAALPRLVVAAVALAVVAVQPPLYVAEVTARGDPALRAGFYAPLVEELVARRVPGPVEVVPMRRHGEAFFVARHVPLARGWLRQVDYGRNRLFYEPALRADAYRRWLSDNAVGWVALARGRHDWAAGREAALVRGGLPFLEPVWADGTWALYRVRGVRP
jgi:hypothetical protein